MTYLCRGCGVGSSLPLFFLDGMFPLRKVRNAVLVEDTYYHKFSAWWRIMNIREQAS